MSSAYLAWAPKWKSTGANGRHYAQQRSDLCSSSSNAHHSYRAYIIHCAVGQEDQQTRKRDEIRNDRGRCIDQIHYQPCYDRTIAINKIINHVRQTLQLFWCRRKKF